MSTASDSLTSKNKDYQRYLAIKEEIRRMSEKTKPARSVIPLPNKPSKKSISIIIYAYKSFDYIEECLDSIENQTYFKDNNNFEILIGIDDCQNTLNKTKEIQKKYRNLRIYVTEKHQGKYVILNTLLDIVKHDIILAFNSEDIMKPNMIEEIITHTDEFDIVKFNYDYFDDEITNIINKKHWFNDGNFLYNKKIKGLTGGYKNWVYAADIELYERAYNFVKVKELEESLFYKRYKKSDEKLSRGRKLRKTYSDSIKRYEIGENILEDVTKCVFKGQKTEKEPKIIINEPVSIIIAAYKVQDYIEQCLDSIEKQTYFVNNKFEILVGVDGCYNTLFKLLSIKDKYRNLRVFMMKDNKGTYVTTNTLLDLISHENIIRFDADDVMKSSMVNKIMNNSYNYDVVRFGFDDFTTDIKNCGRSNYMRALGAIFYKKSVIEKAGGYKDWKCSADYEFLKRIQLNVKIKEINEPLFYRRDHPNSLSNRSDTGLSTTLRRDYNKTVRTYGKGENIKIDKVVNQYIEITSIKNEVVKEIKNVSLLNKLFKPKKEIPVIQEIPIEIYEELPDEFQKFSISIIITAYKTADFIEECLDSVENQTYFKNYDDYEVLVGIDACEDTLNKLFNIKYKYRNLRVFMMKNNQGTYVTSNTLINLAKYDHILRFDSDDIMKPKMLDIIALYTKDNDIVKFGYDTFVGNIQNIIGGRFRFPHGVVLYSKRVFNLAGGYENWKCAADTELLTRVSTFVNVEEIAQRLFYRRQHEQSLTKNVDTKYGSELRQSYKKMIGKHMNLKIEPVINEYDEY